jgi:ornithine carbamoyltransferase
MWQRFTEKARRAVFHAQEEAARLRQSYVGTEHLLLGLIRESESVAAVLLARMRVPLDRIRAEVEQELPPAHESIPYDMQLTPRAKRVIDLAYEEARRLNNNYIGTEHLLLGLIREEGGLAARVLVKLGADLERTRREVHAMQEEEPQDQPQRSQPQPDARPKDHQQESRGGPRFTKRTTRALFLARVAATRLGRNRVDTEHILLALVRETGTAAIRILERLGITPQQVREAVRNEPPSEPAAPDDMQLTPSARRVVELAREEAGDDFIGTEHLLLALALQKQGLAARVLEKLGLDPDRIRLAVYDIQKETGLPDENSRDERTEDRMWHRFTEHSKWAIIWAQEEAARLGQSYVRTEHLLLGLIREEGTVTVRILERLGIPRERIRTEVERHLPVGQQIELEDMRLTPGGRRVIELAYDEARQRNHNYIGTEHLLLGLIRRGGLAARVLTELSADLERIRQEVDGLHEGTLRPQATPAGEEPQGDQTRKDQPEQEERRETARPQEQKGAGQMYRGFTERAREAVFLAQEEAVLLGQHEGGPEHLLLALLRQRDSVARRLLSQMGISLNQVRGEIVGEPPPCPVPMGPDVSLTQEAKRAIDLAYQEAHQLDHNYVGTEHLLLALMRQKETLAGRVLEKLGADPDRIRLENYDHLHVREQTAESPEEEKQESRMWHRFTERARRVVFFAQEEAVRLGERYVGTEHLLLGLARESDSVAGRLLSRLGVPTDRIRPEVEQHLPAPRREITPADMQLTPRAKRAIDLAYEEARRLNNNYIGTEHLLLGLIREGDGLVARVLVKLGADLERTRLEVHAMQAEMSQPQATSPAGQPMGEQPQKNTEREPARWQQFTERARRVLFRALGESVRLGRTEVDTEHILLGLTLESGSTAYRLLERLVIPLDQVRAEINPAPPPEPAVMGDPHFTPGGRRAVDLAQEEARQLDKDYIGTEHLLLGLIREGEGKAARILAKLGATLDAARGELQKMSDEETAAKETGGGGQPEAAIPVPVTAQPESAWRYLWELPYSELRKLAEYARSDRNPAGAASAAMVAVDLARTNCAGVTDLRTIADLSRDQAWALLSLARVLKDTLGLLKTAHREILSGKTLAMLFEKPSLRTRVSFDTGMYQLGGHTVYLAPAEIQLGTRETVPDVARNLERMVDGIVARVFAHATIEELAAHARIPVINGLSELEHPCQALADLLTVWERRGRIEGQKIAYVGDGNNVAHSLLLLGAKLGAHVALACPDGYHPQETVLAAAREEARASGGSVQVVGDPQQACAEADAIYTDVWTSMGQEAESQKRLKDFHGFQVDETLAAAAKPDHLFMHCLPAHRGEEVSAGVMDGPNSVVFDQAENRLHAQKAVLAVLLG